MVASRLNLPVSCTEFGSIQTGLYNGSTADILWWFYVLNRYKYLVSLGKLKAFGRLGLNFHMATSSWKLTTNAFLHEEHSLWYQSSLLYRGDMVPEPWGTFYMAYHLFCLSSIYSILSFPILYYIIIYYSQDSISKLPMPELERAACRIWVFSTWRKERFDRQLSCSLAVAETTFNDSLRCEVLAADWLELTGWAAYH